MRHDGPVVIALDGSPHSARTLDWGIREAGLRGAAVVLARAYQEPREYDQWTWFPLVPDLHFDTEAKQYLADALESVSAQRPDVHVSTRLLHGPSVPQLRALSDDAQLLVVGARGRGGRRGIGRVAAHLAAHARCPVVVVREDVVVSLVVVGVDGSPSSLDAADAAAREAAMHAVPLVVVHARPTVATPYGHDGAALPPITTADDDPTHRAAERAVARLREAQPTVDVRLELVDDDPAHALVSLAGERTLLVVGSRGLGAFRGMLLGSVSSEVVRDARTDVLVVHGGDAA